METKLERIIYRRKDMNEKEQSTRVKKTLQSTGNVEGAIELHSELLTHFNERFLALRGRKPTYTDRYNLIDIATEAVARYFSDGVS